MEKQQDYWKLKALELEGQVLQRQLQDVRAMFDARRRAAYLAAGLDPDLVYMLDDQAETFTPTGDRHAITD
jgi:hypothetical protein